MTLTSFYVRRLPWLWGRKRRLAAAGSCLEEHGWQIERLTTKELDAIYMDEGINFGLHFHPPERPSMGWTGYQPPGDGQLPLPTECFPEFVD